MLRPPLVHCLLLSVIIFAIYLPGTGNFFIADSIANIEQNPVTYAKELNIDSISAALSGNQSGILKRPISSLTFSLNYYFSGAELVPSDFKITNIAIHSFNTVLVYVIALLLFRVLRGKEKTGLSETTLSLFAAAVWALHPIQLSGVLYVVQRMASLSALFVFLGLLAFIIGRIRLHQNKRHALTLMYGGIFTGTVLGALCKENAILLPAFALALELTIFTLIYNADLKRRLLLFYSIFLIVPGLAAVTYITLNFGAILQDYGNRNFTLEERLLTEPRVLFLYLNQIIAPTLSQFGLYHDDVTISRSLWQPYTTLPALVAVLLSAGSALALRKRLPVASFAIIWFLTAHLMESTIFPLALMYEHRNYVALFGFALATIYYLSAALHRLNLRRVISFAPPLLIIVLLSILTSLRVNIWATEESLTQYDANNKPNSAISQALRAGALLNQHDRQREAYPYLIKSASLLNEDITSLVIMARLLEGFSIRLKNGTFPSEAYHSEPTRYDAPLILNEAYIHALSKIVDHEIVRRLSGNSRQLQTVLALGKISQCITKEEARACVNLKDKAAKWLNIVIDDPRYQELFRTIPLLNRAWLHAFDGRIEAAIQDLDDAYTTSPTEIPVLIEKLTLLITIHDWSAAEELIKEIENHPEFRPHHAPQFKASRSFFDDEYKLSNAEP